MLRILLIIFYNFPISFYFSFTLLPSTRIKFLPSTILFFFHLCCFFFFSLNSFFVFYFFFFRNLHTVYENERSYEHSLEISFIFVSSSCSSLFFSLFNYYFNHFSSLDDDDITERYTLKVHWFIHLFKSIYLYGSGLIAVILSFLFSLPPSLPFNPHPFQYSF